GMSRMQNLHARVELFIVGGKIIDVAWQFMFGAQAATMVTQIQCIEMVAVMVPECGQLRIVEVVAPPVDAQHYSLGLAPKPVAPGGGAVANQRGNCRPFGIGAEVQSLVLEVLAQWILNPFIWLAGE